MKIASFLLCSIIIWKASFVFSQTTNVIKPLGFSINTAFSETHPLITADGKTLYFTSTRPLSSAEQKRNVASRANIYRSLFNEDSQAWGEAQPLPDIINDTESSNTAFALSNDGQLMLFYRKDSQGKGNVYATKLNGNFWGEPSLISDYGIAPNSVSGSISSDNKTFYFVGKSEINGDSTDIWKGKISENGSVYDISRIKDIINSADEVASVFIHPDGKTLYYSASTFSDNFDVFSSQLDSTKWKSPLRISEPVNSSSFERDFTMSANGRFAIFSSNRNEGQFDLYTVQYGEENAFSPSLTLLNGIVKDAENGSPINGKISVFINYVQQPWTFNSNGASGAYLICLPNTSNRFGINITADGYLFHSDYIEKSAGYSEKQKNIELTKIAVGKSLDLKNIFFEENSSKFRPESAIEINAIYILLLKYPSLKIEISALTSLHGEAMIDKKLSYERSKELMNQLIRLGIAKKRLRIFKIPKNTSLDGIESIKLKVVNFQNN